jgi:RNA polymerase sigma factor (sigma-70 family)
VVARQNRVLTDEQTLIVRAQRGDLQAYDALVRAYEQPAFRAAYFITRDEGDAAEVAQEAFLRAHRALASFKSEQPFRPWLLKIVTNLALNRVQAAQRRMRMNERYAAETMTTQDQPTPERALAEREQSERLAQAVHQLAPHEQALIALRYFLELPEQEVAAALNVPKGTIKSRLHRTLAKLRDIIRRDFPDLNELTASGESSVSSE